MKYIYIGDIVNTHGVKGEVRILSDFKYKDHIFKKDFAFYVGHDKEKLVVSSYRYHKIYDMVTFDGINNINDVIMYKGDKVYINKEDLKIDGYLDEDLIGFDVYMNNLCVGKVKSIMHSKAHGILIVESSKGKNMIPNVKEIVEKVDLKDHKIYINNIEGLINEN